MATELLGDKVTKAMECLGVTILVRRFFPVCNCEARRKWLNWLHRRALGVIQIKCLAVSKDHPGHYASWCNLDNAVFMTEDKERACHFETIEGCRAWCKADGSGTALFTARRVVLR